MKKFYFNVVALFLTALNFADDENKMRSGSQSSTNTGTSKATGSYVGGPVARVKSLFESIPEWTPGQFRNAVQLAECQTVRDPEGNTLLHRAIDDGNVAIVELIVKEYNFVGDNARNSLSLTPRELAIQKGPEFAGIFTDMPKETAHQQ